MLTGGLTIYPGKSMTANIGFDGTGIHCGTGCAYETELAESDVSADDVPVEESMEARRVWSDLLIRLGDTKQTPSLFSRLRRWAKGLIR